MRLFREDKIPVFESVREKDVIEKYRDDADCGQSFDISSLGDEELEKVFGVLFKPITEDTIAWLSDYSRGSMAVADGTGHVVLGEWFLNNQRYLNRYMISVNRKLAEGGYFIACFVTARRRHDLYYKRGYPRFLARTLYAMDFFWHRMCPKMRLIRKFYFLVNRNVKRALPRMEVMGRLYFCGFELYRELYVGEHYFFIARKVGVPCSDEHPSYSPVVRLPRVGKDGKMIYVYKFRTMYAYSEYLQKPLYESNRLEKGGKIKDDFRVSGWGRFLRRHFIDEWPMFINVLKGEMCLVGVRPLSRHYFSLYSKELQQLRTKYKPGILPPFYADNPETLEEIQESEMRYLKAYEKHKIKTKWVYFWRIMRNIVFRHRHSN